MQDVTAEAAPLVDIWPYVDDLDPNSLGGVTIGDVRCIYRDAHNRFDQVLIDIGRSNTFLVVVVDRRLPAVIGHHLLELNEKYGL